jgi:hypothetical protein
MVDANAVVAGAPNREEPKVGAAEEAAADEAPNGEEPKAGAGEDAAAGCEKENGEEEEAEEPAAAEPPPKLKGDAMVGAALIWARF